MYIDEFQHFITPSMAEILAGAMLHLSPESPQAVMELAWRGMSRQAEAHDTPMCVIAAADDALFTPDEAQPLLKRLLEDSAIANRCQQLRSRIDFDAAMTVACDYLEARALK